jgi:hypothetical protein
MGAFGAMGDASRLDHVAKQTEIGQIKAHGLAFVLDEGRIRQMLIARYIYRRHISCTAKRDAHFADADRERSQPSRYRLACIAACGDIG